MHSLSNTSDSFKPYDASSVLGNLTPTQDPKKLKCQTFAQILGFVVSFVLMIVLTPYMGPVAAAAVGSAAGNLVQQYTILMANGLYDWNKEWDGLRRSLGLKGNFWDAMGGDLAAEIGKFVIGARIGIPIGAIDYWVNKDEPNEAQTTLYNPSGHGAGRRLDRRSVAISAASAAAASYATSGVARGLERVTNFSGDHHRRSSAQGRAPSRATRQRTGSTKPSAATRTSAARCRNIARWRRWRAPRRGDSRTIPSDRALLARLRTWQ